MIFNALIPSFTTRRIIENKLQTGLIKPDACEISSNINIAKGR